MMIVSPVVPVKIDGNNNYSDNNDDKNNANESDNNIIIQWIVIVSLFENVYKT